MTTKPTLIVLSDCAFVVDRLIGFRATALRHTSGEDLCEVVVEDGAGQPHTFCTRTAYAELASVIAQAKHLHVIKPHGASCD